VPAKLNAPALKLLPNTADFWTLLPQQRK
jgi:hypothetical protein